MKPIKNSADHIRPSIRQITNRRVHRNHKQLSQDSMLAEQQQKASRLFRHPFVLPAAYILSCQPLLTRQCTFEDLLSKYYGYLSIIPFADRIHRPFICLNIFLHLLSTVFFQVLSNSSDAQLSADT